MFIAKSKNAAKIKALFEVLFQNMATVSLTIDKNGITSENITNQHLLINVNIPSSYFDSYVFDYDEPQYIGLGSHINSFFKSVKNKTMITFKIDKPFFLDISITSLVDDYTVSLAASIENVQNIESFTMPEYTSEPTKLSPSTFNSICKLFKSPFINVTKKYGQLLFSFEIPQISVKTLTFGKMVAENKELFFKTYKSDQFIRIGKLSSFVTQPISIYTEAEKPLYIEAVSDTATVKLTITQSEDL